MATSSAVSKPAVGHMRLPALLSARQARLLCRAAAVAAAIVALKSFVLDPLTGHFNGTFEDFNAYMDASRAHGGSPYSDFSGTTPVMSGFVYPPFAAVLLRPLALLDVRTALSLWLILSVAATLAATLVLARTALPRAWPRTELAILAAVAFAPAAYNYWHGQVNSVILLLLAVAYWSYVSGRKTTTGVILGFAAGIKVAPIVLLFLLLRRRWWRSAVAMTVTGVATAAIGVAVLGVGVTREFVTTILPTLSRPVGWIYNQSLTGAVARAVDHSVLRVQPSSALLEGVCLAAGALMLGACVWVVRAGTRPPEERGAEFGLAVVAMLLTGSLAWFAHLTAMLIPLFAALGLVCARGRDTERRLVRATSATVIVLGVMAPLAIAMLSMPELASLSAGPWWWPFLQLASLPCLVSLWFAITLRRSLRDTDARPHPAGLEPAAAVAAT